ncbi:diaminobutyrate acetyltransferase [Nonomuraea sp. KC401]|uniref:diaminobutyrate acetyltransferase n=1 Tax=unclassified Nonomuraea TaxID=2593643 RepID=UPI0010FE14C1|nr:MULTISPECIES: diaminobutyrate acetyltransferase [unclassified Nonomuraea]NBE96625.1 diaminobutyrate acetyltransferase [Nonomuraea sp. K271]TLF68347.1 diaminobutyrate acetyltransferase [Nonomuraea sp. KC401]
MSSAHPRPQADSPSSTEELGPPRLEDGRELWRITRDSKILDLNSPYSYVLWCRDFADTSVVARGENGVRGFITGFIRPREPETLFVWQVAVGEEWRGRSLASRMLGYLAGTGCRFMEATVTPDNIASDRLFTAFAREQGADLERRPLLGEELFPQDHQAEVLYRIGPLDQQAPIGDS